MKLHVCVECLVDPPRSVRPIAAGVGKRSWRCATHQRAFNARRKERQSAAGARRRSGLSDELLAQLWALQGERCPCGARPTRRRPDSDHDHEAAATHDHPEDRACEMCMRGLLCRRCNREIVGRLDAAALRRLADYIDDPPMRRLQRLISALA